MITYTDLYELLRKEKYSENLQLLPKTFLEDIAVYFNDRKEQSAGEEDMFQDAVVRNKKQLENSVALFKELILRRKKKLLNLIFVATETGIMKRDYENMMFFEQQVFDSMVKVFEEGDKQMNNFLQGKGEKDKSPFSMILFNEDVDQFVDMTGNTVGPFKIGQLANLENEVANILVSGGKARYIDQ